MVADGIRDGQSLDLKGVDPETCMIVFKNHWAQVRNIFLHMLFININNTLFSSAISLLFYVHILLCWQNKTHNHCDDLQMRITCFLKNSLLRNSQELKLCCVHVLW